MQGWVVAGAWLFAVLFALVLLSFTGYELSWKARRLLADRDRLVLVMADLASVSADLQRTAERARTIPAGRSATGPAEPFVG